MPTLISRLTQDIWLNNYLLRSGTTWASSAQYRQAMESTRFATLLQNGDLQVIEDANSLEPGFDIILVMGNSNSVGFGTGILPQRDFSHPRILQYPSQGTFLNTPILAIDPLVHAETLADSVGYVMTLAREYVNLIPLHRRVLIVPVSKGAVSFVLNNMNPGNPDYNFGVSQCNAAIALNPANRIVAICTNVFGRDNELTKAQYIVRLDAFINGLRRDITGAANVPVFIVGASRESIAFTGTEASGTRGPIHEGAMETPTRLPRVVAIQTNIPQLTSISDGIHFNADSQRRIGSMIFQAGKALLTEMATSR